MANTDPPPFRIVFVNGPPRSGKDTVGNLIKTTRTGENLGPTLLAKFATAVKRATHDRLGLVQGPRDPKPGHPLPADYFETRKDKQGIKGFPKGMTPRDAYIDFSENHAKPEHGEDVFGVWVRDRLVGMVGGNEMVVITDSGFEPEAVPIIEAFGPEHCLLLRLSRKGTSFDGDSRSYIDLSKYEVETIDLTNDYDTEPELQEALRELGLFG